MVVKLKTIVSGALAALCAAALWGCGGGRWWGDESMPQAAEEAATERPRSSDCRMPAPMDSLRPRLERRMREIFNDSNYLHIATAERIGIRPLRTLRDAWDGGSRLERISSCEAYYLDNLTHSLPYLVPQAHRLLKDIGMAFRDSLQARGGGNYRIKVTSVLRTPRLVSRLRRRNRNAVDTSAHLYGTTFDISYAKFICNSTRTPRTQEDMKNLLAEVVNDMRSRGRCYVKYERKQACFHITAR